jgi:hypothetical protein
MLPSMISMAPATAPSVTVVVSDEMRRRSLGEATYILGLPSPTKATLLESSALALVAGSRYHVKGPGVDAHVVVESGQAGAYIVRFAPAPPAPPGA